MLSMHKLVTRSTPMPEHYVDFLRNSLDASVDCLDVSLDPLDASGLVHDTPGHTPDLPKRHRRSLRHSIQKVGRRFRPVV